jgi:hypothetical protein
MPWYLHHSRRFWNALLFAFTKHYNPDCPIDGLLPDLQGVFLLDGFVFEADEPFMLFISIAFFVFRDRPCICRLSEMHRICGWITRLML